MTIQKSDWYPDSLKVNGKIPEYSVWVNMKKRCKNPNSSSFEYYGGRGITVCREWSESFMCFLNDMGRRPSPDHTLDRIDTNGNYEPGNCRWVTWDQQAKNRRPRSCRKKPK